MNLQSNDRTLDGLFFEGFVGPLGVPRPIIVDAKYVDAGAPSSAIAGLTARMARGDEPAYREFYALYFPRLLRYLLVMTQGNEAAAKEALQLTLLRVVRHIRTFDAEPVLWSWLTVLARSSLVDEVRKRRRYLRILDRFFQQEQHAPAETDPSDSRWLALLQHNLAALPMEDRDLVERKYFEEQSVREIADATGSTGKAVESRLTRIRRKLRDLILRQLTHETEIQP